jgi:hypothetical protein
MRLRPDHEAGFTIVEIIIATIIFPLLFVAIAQIFNLIRLEYAAARQYNEIYGVLSACPELDRALQYDILSSSTNCFPNNVFSAEAGYTNTIKYSPTISVTDTSSLSASDPLLAVPDSKVVDLTVNLQQSSTTSIPVKMRLLITRNGIAQL